MKTLHEFVAQIGRAEISLELGLVPTAIANALDRGKMPPGWYPTIKRLADSKEVEVSPRFFSWRKPEDADCL